MSRIFEKQMGHLIGLLILIAGLLLATRIPGCLDGRFLGLSTTAWLVLSAGIAVIHQVYVWLAWRLELHGRRLTLFLGKAAFPLYAVVFAVLIIGRLVLITLLSISNAGTLRLYPIAATSLAILLLLPVVYLLYSIGMYFGFTRAFGLDHFDPAAPSWPLVRRGIFRWCRNSMYLFGMLALYIPAIYCRSIAALAVAIFSHAYIWVHYFFTEKPDMARIYRNN